MSRILEPLFVSACLLGLSAHAQAATVWNFATGADYSAGKYGAASDTTVFSVPFAARAQTGPFRVDLTVPYLWEKGPGDFAGGGVVVPNGKVTSRSGLGDVNLDAAWQLHADNSSFPAIEIQGNLKVPTAGTGLGTGKFDYGLQANINHTFGRVMLFGSLGYQWMHNFHGFDLRNGVAASVGANFRIGNDVNAGLTANYRQPYYLPLGEQVSASPYLLWSFAPKWRVTTYLLTGFSKASPRIGGGVRLILLSGG
jgi:hypothetical protein